MFCFKVLSSFNFKKLLKMLGNTRSILDAWSSKKQMISIASREELEKEIKINQSI